MGNKYINFISEDKHMNVIFRHTTVSKIQAIERYRQVTVYLIFVFVRYHDIYEFQ